VVLHVVVVEAGLQSIDGDDDEVDLDGMTVDA